MATMTKEHLFRTSVNLPEPQRRQVIGILNARLADSLDLKTQAKFAHWNVKGAGFAQLHELFDQLSTNLEAHLDLIAERATALGGVATGTLRQAAAASTLPEYDFDAVNGEQHVHVLAERLGAFANQVRKDIDEAARLGDQSTADLFTELSRAADKDLWFLEAHLQG